MISIGASNSATVMHSENTNTNNERTMKRDVVLDCSEGRSGTDLFIESAISRLHVPRTVNKMVPQGSI